MGINRWNLRVDVTNQTNVKQLTLAFQESIETNYLQKEKLKDASD